MRCVVALASPAASTTSVNRECVSAASSTSRVFSLAPALVVASTPAAVVVSSRGCCGLISMELSSVIRNNLARFLSPGRGGLCPQCARCYPSIVNRRAGHAEGDHALAKKPPPPGARISAELTDLDYALPGTLSRRFMRCGKDNCRCKADPCRATLWMTTWTPKGVTVGDDGRLGLDPWQEESIASPCLLYTSDAAD